MLKSKMAFAKRKYMYTIFVLINLIKIDRNQLNQLITKNDRIDNHKSDCYRFSSILDSNQLKIGIEMIDVFTP